MLKILGVVIVFWSFAVQAFADLKTLQQEIVTIDPACAVALNDESGKRIIAYNPDKLMIPASIVKIVIAQAAYDLLGKDFRFKTEFYTDRNYRLAIKGWGDPFLVSEEINLVSEQPQIKRLPVISEILLDSSAFSSDVQIPGTSNSLNPYDALNGALVVNFNTIFVGRTHAGVVYSAEEPTPLTSLAIEKANSIPPGKKERINLTENPAESLAYVGQLFSKFFVAADIPVTSKKLTRTIVKEKDWQLIYRHHSSRSLTFIFEGLMKYSNNFIANQIFLVIGAEKMGYPASLSKSRKVLQTYLKNKWGFANADMVLDEASGISRKNRMTAGQMMTILETFRENSGLLSGKNNLKIKSGTLTGVYNYAGYIQTESGIRPFVIITENAVNQRDKLLKLLTQFSS
ncbi:MAG: D-alanyl-D-alanine carboxypeptidase [Proteobacteria bacterium]|nr:D-alanyl-D-alanine carboxypeptidase [Pseudomonadota bacterium]